MLNATGGAALLRDLLITANEATLQAVQLLPATPRASTTVFLRDPNLYRSARWRVLATHGNLAFIETEDALSIFDISDPSAPRHLSDYPAQYLDAVLLTADYAYVNRSATFEIIDIRDPRNPRQVAVNGSGVTAMSRAGNRIYGFVGYQAVPRIGAFDISNPAAPVRLATVQNDAVRVWAYSDDLIYVLDQFRQRVTVRRTSDHTIAGVWTRPAEILEMKIMGSRAYSLGANKLEILDVTDPIAPALLGEVAIPDQSDTLSDLAIIAGHVYINTRESLSVVDVTQENAPRVAARNSNYVGPIATDGQRLHVLSRLNGYSILEPHPQIWLQPSATSLRIDGPPGTSGQLESSSDLDTWSNPSSLTLTDEPVNIPLPDLPQNRFFRFRSNSN